MRKPSCKHSWIRTACLTICLLAAGPAGAQSPSPEAMAAARELIVTMRAADYFKTLMPAIMQQLKPAIVQNRPQVERDLLVEDTMTLPVQINGKKRADVTVGRNAPNPEIEAAVLALDAVKTALAGATPRKIIVVPQRIVNVVV